MNRHREYQTNWRQLGFGFWRLLLILLVVGSLDTGLSEAQVVGSGMTVQLTLSETVLPPVNPPTLSASITVDNISGADLLTRAGFSGEPWEVLLVFSNTVTGATITAHQTLGDPNAEDTPPTVVWIVDGAGINRKIYVKNVETVGSTFTRTVGLADVQQLYDLVPGAYTVQVLIPFQRYEASQLVGGAAPSTSAVFEGFLTSNVVGLTVLADVDGDGWTVTEADQNGPTPIAVDCNDDNAAINPGATEIQGNGIDDDCNAATSDAVVVNPATVTIIAELFEVGGGSQPGTSKSPLVDLPVQLFDRTSTCVGLFGTSWQHFASLWGSSCPAPANGRTDGTGTLVMTVPPGEYLAIAEYEVPGGETIYAGKNVGAVTSGESLAKGLKVILKSNGQTVPGKSQKFTGSELYIIEPEYVEWDSTQELYPFIFESVGDWTVTTTVAPPEGFVADHESLSTEVNSTLEAVQFTVTDVGSDWVATEVTYELTHPGKEKKVKKTKVKHKIGVRLSKELAEAKGLTRWGKPRSSKQEQ